jgi:hypothetical protein
MGGGIHVVLTGVPRTKKTSNRIVTINFFDKRLKRMNKLNKILPSEAHQEWFKAAMTTVPVLQNWARKEGIELPLKGPVHVTAVFYRDALRGDLTGYMQAIADWMQAPVTKLRNGVPKVTRQGAGIIVDDGQIACWDGSRLEKDSINPRVDITVRPLQGHLEMADWTLDGEEGGDA